VTILDTGKAYPQNAVLSIPLPKDPDQRVLATIQGIAGMTDEARHMPYVAQVAQLLEATRDLVPAPPGIPANLFALFRLIKRRFTFTRDPPGHELVRFADYWADQVLHTSGRLEADCDDLAAFAVAIVKVMGYRPVLIVVGTAAKGPFQHIFYGAIVAGQLIPFDPQETREPGIEPPSARRHEMRL